MFVINSLFESNRLLRQHLSFKNIDFLEMLISKDFFVITCIFKFFLYILKCIYAEIGRIVPLGIYIYLSIDMNTYIHMYANNFDL